ncbi:MAG: Fic family protein, partial [Chlamydiota bacterium]
IRSHRYNYYARQISPNGFVVGIKSKQEKYNKLLDLKLEINKPNHHITELYADWFKKTFNLNLTEEETLPKIDIPAKWLQEIIKGWYLVVKPDLPKGDSSPWYASFWDFLRIYLHHHFENQYCLSAENSLDLHTGSTTIPNQVIVISPSGGGSAKNLPFQTSLFIYADPKNIPEERVSLQGLQVMSLSYALCKVSSSYFQKNPQEAEIALRLIRNASELSQILLKYNFKTAAARILGAYQFLGNNQMKEELQHDLSLAGWKIKEENPFTQAMPLISSTRIKSPYVARIFSLWKEQRERIIPYFPPPSKLPKNKKTYLTQLEDIYGKDAYNSLSIEGYQVDETLIERVRNNRWNPDENPQDREERNALAARGYYEAFEEVKKSINLVFQGNNSGDVAEKDLKKWFQKLFAPMVRAGIIRPEDLLGYRKAQVFIRNSRYVPLPREALPDAMETLFECLKNEPHPAVRAVLGHYIFGFVHPYMDGNGRIGRFLMNTMFVSGGYPWTIVQVKNRKKYLNSLEQIVTEQNMEPFASYISEEMQNP